jgi:proline dehydrogenase
VSAFTGAVVGLTGSRPVRSAITQTRAGRALAARFVAGEGLDEAIAAAQRLNGSGMVVSLDHLGEEVKEVSAAEAAASSYRDCLEGIVNGGVAGNISVKLTQLGLAIDQEMALTSLARLAASAAALGTTVTIDMEDSRYTEATLSLYETAQARYGNLGVCLQAALRRTPDDLERVLAAGGHVRLCKGAYRELPEVAYQRKVDVDASFAALLQRLMVVEKVRPAVATHDARLIALTRTLAPRRSSPFEFQMLYGVRPALQSELVAAGYSLRVYLPFGSEWYPYLTRRLAERPANLGFFLRSLLPFRP